jgi:transient receptor potential cation channel subfamily A protein 1
MTPFHFICKYSKDYSGNTPDVETLLEKMFGDNKIVGKGKYIFDENILSMQDDSGMTGLHYACLMGNNKVAFMILEKMNSTESTHINEENKEEYTAILIAAQEGNIEMVDIILEKNGNWENKEKLNIVHKAAMCGHVMLLEKLKSKEKFLSYAYQKTDSKKENLLHLAVDSGSIDTVKWILNHTDLRWQIDDENVKGNTPLHMAARLNKLEVLKMLLEKSKGVNKEDKNKETALLLASQNGNIDVVEILLINMADVNKTDCNSNSAIMLAAANNHKEIVTLLLENKADLNKKNTMFQNILHIVIANENSDLLRIIMPHIQTESMLEERDLIDESPLHVAAKNSQDECINILFNSKFMSSKFMVAKNFYGKTPCHIAARTGNFSVLKAIILKYPFTTTITDNDGNIPAYLSAENGKQQCMHLLIGCKQTNLCASTDLKNKLLYVAACNGHAHIVKELLYNENVEKALKGAIENNQRSVIEVIIDSKFWKESLRCQDSKQIKSISPMKQLIKFYPDMAEKVLDKCIIETEDNTWKINTEFIDNFDLEPAADCISYITVNKFQAEKKHPLMTMAKSRNENLLKHPVSLYWTKNQWASFGKPIFFVEAVLYIFFLISLSTYCLDEFDECSFKQMYHFKPNKTSKLRMSCEDPTSKIAYYFTLISTILCLLYEVFQLIGMRLKYLMGLSNYVDIYIYTTTLVLLWSPNIDIQLEQCSSPQCWRWPVSAVLLPVAWLNFLRYLKFFSYFGICLIMFVQVFRTVVKLSLMFGVFILAFAFSFNITLKDQQPFKGFGWSYLKTVAMSTGEFDYDDIFRENQVKLHTITVITFVGLVIVMTIVLMNMLIGIAVDNIRKVQKDAEVERVSAQIKLVLEMRTRYQLFPKGILNFLQKYLGRETDDHNNIIVKHKKKTRVTEMNKCGKIRERFLKLWRYFTIQNFMSTERIFKSYEEKKKCQKSDFENLVEIMTTQQQEMKDEMRKIKNEMGKMKNEMGKIIL